MPNDNVLEILLPEVDHMTIPVRMPSLSYLVGAYTVLAKGSGLPTVNYNLCGASYIGETSIPADSKDKLGHVSTVESKQI